MGSNQQQRPIIIDMLVLQSSIDDEEGEKALEQMLDAVGEDTFNVGMDLLHRFFVHDALTNPENPVQAGIMKFLDVTKREIFERYDYHHARIETLEGENQTVRAEVAELRRQLVEVKRELTLLKSAIRSVREALKGKRVQEAVRRCGHIRTRVQGKPSEVTDEQVLAMAVKDSLCSIKGIPT